MSDGLFGALVRHARERGASVALRDAVGTEDRALTWRELLRVTRAFAARLRRDPPGVSLVVAPNCVELEVALLAGLWSGESVLPVAPQLPPAGLRGIARRAGASRVIGGPAARAALTGAADGIDLGSVLEGGLEDAAPPAEDGSILLPSSGTTGPPKLARRHLTALEVVGRNCRDAIGIRAADVMLLAIPLHHSYGIDHGLLAALLAGCRVDLQPGFAAASVSAALASDGVTIVPGTPFIFDALSRVTRSTANRGALRRVYSAGSPLPRRVFDAFRAAYGLRVGQLYGATEFGSVSFSDPDLEGFRPESVGTPFPGVELRILDPERPTPSAPLAVGREGHVAVCTPSMMTGYLDAPGEILDGGFFLTGDLGRLDEMDRLTLTGRLKLMVDVGGLKVNPVEVEEVLMQHPAVREAAVVAVPFTDTAQRLKAIVVLEEGAAARPADLRRFAQEHLIRYKVPRSFEIRSELPRSATGKLLRGTLASLPGGATAGDGRRAW